MGPEKKPFSTVSGFFKRQKVMVKSKGAQSCCELCANYVYDEDAECYECLVSLDEDEMAGFLSRQQRECPFFRFGDEYTIVRKQN